MKVFKSKPVLLQVYYYRPDFPSIIQDFTWGYDDVIPELLRTHKFLNHWHKNIDAIIAEILISIDNGHHTKWRNVDTYIKIN